MTEHHRTLESLAGLGSPRRKTVVLDPHPSAVGRWQATRAGAVNSWQWSEEQFLFSAGWLALVGMNGSGKSLTGGVLCPTFIDGDVSSKSLSASGDAAGTLTSIHTQGRPGPAKSGTWWQEYGRTDPGPDGTTCTQWLTAGLWLKSSGGERTSLERAWFLVPARVNAQLTLERDGMPVDIGDLASQLAQHGGLLFTSSTTLENACKEHASVVRREEEYTEAVRTAMYQPLDASQMDALGSVLRALRSVQANDKISPSTMQATLTSALPSLDARRVQTLADALAKTEQLQDRLRSARKEKEVLGSVRTVYRRYVAAAASTAAVEFRDGHARHRQVIGQHRALSERQRNLTESLREAGQLVRDEERRLGLLAQTIKTLEGRVAGHPGADLGSLAAFAQQQEERARTSAREAGDAAGAHLEAQKTCGEAEREAEEAVGRLASLTREVGRSAAEASAGAFHDAMAQAADRLGASRGTQPAVALEQEVKGAREKMAAWLEAQSSAAEEVSAALGELSSLLKAQADAQERYDGAQQDSEAAAGEAQRLVAAAEQAEEEARRALERFAAGLVRLPAPPSELVAASALDPVAIQGWLQESAAEALTALDLTGVQARAQALAAGAASAVSQAKTARLAASEAGSRARDRAGALAVEARSMARIPTAVGEMVEAVQQVAELAELAPSQDAAPMTDRLESTVAELAESARGELGRRRELLQSAGEALDAAATATAHASRLGDEAGDAREAATRLRARADDCQADADQAGRAWAAEARRWAASLTVLDRTLLRLPDEQSIPRPVDAEDLKEDAATAHRLAFTRITAELTTAKIDAASRAARVEEIDDRIAEAERSEAGPDQPGWRPTRHGRPGAPLWAVVDFAGHLPAEEAGRLEGALLASGALDAWVSPDGELTAGDVALLPTSACEGPTLADLLVPDPQAPVAADRIRAVLASIRVLEHGQTPAPGQAAFTSDGTVHLGPLHAQSPEGWTPQYIGASARERMRQILLADLRVERQEAVAALESAHQLVDALTGDLSTADRERTLPLAARWLELASTATTASMDAARQEATAEEVEGDAASALRTAEEADHAGELACRAAFVEPSTSSVRAAQAVCTELPGLVMACLETARTALAGTTAAHAAAQNVVTVQAELAVAEAAWRTVQDAATEIEQDRTSLPGELVAVLPARAAAAEGLRRAALAADALVDLEREVGGRGALVHDAKTTLRSKARTTHVTVPTDADALHRHRQTLRDLQRGLGDWSDEALRAFFTLSTAAGHRSAASDAERRADALRERAETDATAAETARHHYTEELRQHDQPYKDLVTELEDSQKAQAELRESLDAHKQERTDVEVDLALVSQELDGYAGILAEAAAAAEKALETVQGLFDHGLVDELAGAEALSRPESSADAVHTIQSILEQGGTSAALNAEEARRAEQTTRSNLEGRVRTVLEKLLEIRRHVTTEEDPRTGWRRVVVTEHGHDQETGTASIGAKPLRQALADLDTAITSLENDFNDQVQTEIKGVVFSELRKDINVRIHTAETIVENIRNTLKNVRTGVARVGVKLEWKPKNDDPVAREALSLIRDVNHEGSFDRMYDFFVEQLKNEEGTHLTWAKRVEHVFDYRHWYTWEISLTHRSFSDDPAGDAEVFQTVSPRRNPLARLSAGEKRLATMLPLLAAAHAFYSTSGYEGPRAVFIDELNAALDAPNLRMLLALLRTWDFDALVTLPAMQPLLVPETGAVGIHRIHQKSNTMRYTIPSIWTGRGTPQTARIHIGAPRRAADDLPVDSADQRPDDLFSAALQED
ncbi:SbcC/MukB-like Walker B domain-containing protein [Kitasatospora sp. NPDC091335]|uniref:SbcC/MukB-like Walker B domain-containing protein n=1 Tax=Kitasatospora sp. NPDC091335 TaxID=3364085 RepID=UPI0038155C65